MKLTIFFKYYIFFQTLYEESQFSYSAYTDY